MRFVCVCMMKALCPGFANATKLCVQKWRDQVQTARDTIGDGGEEAAGCPIRATRGSRTELHLGYYEGDLSQSCRK